LVSNHFILISGRILEPHTSGHNLEPHMEQAFSKPHVETNSLAALDPATLTLHSKLTQAEARDLSLFASY
jgi:hypothetical protein